MTYTIYNDAGDRISRGRELENLKGMCDLIEGGYILKDETLDLVYPTIPEE